MNYMLRTILFFLLLMGVPIKTDDTHASPSSASITTRLQSYVSDMGERITNAELPLFGALGNYLPFALAGFSLQQFPGQTLMLVTGTLLYLLYRNEDARNAWNKCIMKCAAPKKNRSVVAEVQSIDLDDDFFDFDGDASQDEMDDKGNGW